MRAPTDMNMTHLVFPPHAIPFRLDKLRRSAAEGSFVFVVAGESACAEHRRAPSHWSGSTCYIFHCSLESRPVTSNCLLAHSRECCLNQIRKMSEQETVTAPAEEQKTENPPEESKDVKENGTGDAEPVAEAEKEAPKEMRAVILTGFGGLKTVKILKKPEPTLNEGEVLIRVKAW